MGTKTPADTHPHGIQPRTIAIIAGAGLTAVALGVGIGFKLKANGADSDAQSALRDLEAQHGPSPCSNPSSTVADGCAHVASLRSDRNSANTVSTIGFIGAGVFAAATIGTFFFWPHRSASNTATLALTPVAARGKGGLLVTGTF